MQTIHIRDLSKEQVAKIKKRLQQSLRAGDVDVIFDISSSGGDHDAVFDLIKFLEQERFRSTCFVTRSASAATLLAISCESRKIRKKGKMFLHAVRITIPVTLINGDGSLPRDILQKSRERQEQTDRLLLEKTKITREAITQMMAPGTTGTFTAQEAVKWGLVDEVLMY